MRRRPLAGLAGVLVAVAAAFAGNFPGTHGTFDTTVTPAADASKKDRIVVKYTPDPAKVTCTAIYLTQTCRDVNQDGGLVQPKDFGADNIKHLQDDMTPGGTYVDHVACEKDPYYNGEDAGKDNTSKGSSDGTTATATSLSDAPFYPDGRFPAGVTKIVSSFEVCAVCKDDGKILDCVTWKYERTKGAADKGKVTDATGTAAASQEFKDAKKKFEQNHKNGTVCPEAVAEANPGGKNASPGTNKKSPESPLPEQPFQVGWDLVNSGVQDLFNLQWRAFLDGHPVAGGTVPRIDFFDFATVYFPVPPLPAGPHTLVMQVDPFDAIPEFDESDNQEIDTFEIGAGAGVGTADFGTLALLQVAPNPTRGDLQIAFSVPRTGPVRLEVFDVRGRRVLARVITPGAPGLQLAELELGGEGVSPGVFVIRLSQGSESVVARFTFLP